MDEILKAIENECQRIKEKHNISLYIKNKETDFINCYNILYEDIKNNFMKDTEVLDAHKQAALITISCLKSGLIKQHVLNNTDTISILSQIIAINVGLAHMNKMLNMKLKKKTSCIKQSRI